MFRNIGGILAGFLAGGVVQAAIEALAGYLYPLPENLNINDTVALNAEMQNWPAMAFVLLVVAWAAGSFTTGYVSRWIAKTATSIFWLLPAIFRLIAALKNLFDFWHPGWFWAAGLAVMMPFVLIGWRIREYQNHVAELR